MKSLPKKWTKKQDRTQIRSFLQHAVAHGLLIPEDKMSSWHDLRPSTLISWLHITDRCNLRCTYCYVPHHNRDMTIETAQAAIEATFRSAIRHGYKHVKIKYAGGEPLLQFPMIAALHDEIRRLAEQHAMWYDEIILSNGTLLTPEIVHMMKKLGLRLMISLDGLGKFHDRHRRYADGKGSVETVLGSIDLALEHGVIPNISITVSGQNRAGLPELIGWVLERDLPFSLNFYREHQYSTHHSPDIPHHQTENMLTGMLAAYAVIEANLPSRNLLASLVDRANLAMPHLRTCSVGQNYLVFDAQGRVAKCQMHMDKSVTTVAADDPLASVQTDKAGIQNLSVEDKEECRTCQWKYWCAGGCPLTTFRATGRYDARSPNCEIYKILFPEVLRLEGLRLLKYGKDTTKMAYKPE